MSLRRLLYVPSGRAGAYANGGYAINIFKGCTNGCKYCYVPRFLKMNEEQERIFRTTVVPVPSVLERIEKDVKRLGLLPEPIFLSFTCDPFPVDPLLHQYTGAATEIIIKSGNAVNILTKVGTLATKYFDLLSDDSRNKVGTTLTFYNEQMSRVWEPKAALPIDRVEMLRVAKEAGITTWASIEPVIVPEESLRIMSFAMPYVDEFRIGKWNHDKEANKIDWHKFAQDAVKMMERHNKQYVLKDDLRKFL